MRRKNDSKTLAELHQQSLSKQGSRNQCPRCHCRHIKNVSQIRLGDRTITMRKCAHCGHDMTETIVMAPDI